MKETVKTVLKTWPVVFLVAVALCWLTRTVAAAFGVILPPQPSLAWVKAAHGWRFAKIVAFVIILAPLAEEFIFRFLLFKGPLWLEGKMRRLRPSLAVEERPAFVAVVSSVLFTAAHYVQAAPFPDDAFVALFFFGLAQCWLYRRTNRLWAVALHHGLFNLANLVALFALPE